MDTLDLGVLVSGNGSNLQAILDAIACGSLDARVRVVISNKPGVRAIDRASRAGVEAEVISHNGYATREEFDRALVEALRRSQVQWVVLAGFMRVLGHTFLDAFPMRIINIHPALLPSFPGIDAQAQALEHRVRVTGCTVHFVDGGVDTGPIIGQAVVGVRVNDTRDDLAERILAREHILLVSVLRWISEGKVTVFPTAGRPRVVVRDVSPFIGLETD